MSNSYETNAKRFTFKIPYPLIGQRSKSKSWKGQKHILVMTHSVFARFIWNQRQNVHFSIPYPLIGQRSRSRSQKGQKHILVITRPVFVWFIWNQRQKFHFSIPYPLIGQTSRSKTYFGHNTLNFCPIRMKPVSKCSLFNSLSSDIVTNVALTKVCALPSARSGFPSKM